MSNPVTVCGINEPYCGKEGKWIVTLDFSSEKLPRCDEHLLKEHEYNYLKAARRIDYDPEDDFWKEFNS